MLVVGRGRTEQRSSGKHAVETSRVQRELLQGAAAARGGLRALKQRKYIAIDE